MLFLALTSSCSESYCFESPSVRYFVPIICRRKTQRKRRKFAARARARAKKARAAVTISNLHSDVMNCVVTVDAFVRQRKKTRPAIETQTRNTNKIRAVKIGNKRKQTRCASTRSINSYELDGRNRNDPLSCFSSISIASCADMPYVDVRTTPRCPVRKKKNTTKQTSVFKAVFSTFDTDQ